MTVFWNTSPSDHMRADRTVHTQHVNVHGHETPTNSRIPPVQQYWSSPWSFLSSTTHHHQRGSPMSSSNSDHGSVSSIPSSISATAPLEDTISWPPKGLNHQSVLSLDEAVALVARGAICFEPILAIANHGAQHDVHIYPLLGFINGLQIREATSPAAILADCMSFPLDGAVDMPEPWSTLEQPSMTLCFGRFPGTVTLTRYLGMLNCQTASVDSPPKAMLHEIDFYQITDRLRYLQDVKDAPFEMTEAEEYFLHSQLIVDPELDNTRELLEQDIDALSSLLNCHIWIDFSDLRNQIVAQQFADDTGHTSMEFFLHQILLSAELDRRIRVYATNAGRCNDKLVSALSRKVAWSVLLSRIFLEKMDFEVCGIATASFAGFISMLLVDKIRQLDKIWEIGYALQWPRMEEVKSLVQKEAVDRAMHFRWSTPSLTFLLGLTLPGPCASFMAMSCLVDCSPAHQENLVRLQEMWPQSGFQYLSNTYWQWESIVGKVLGAMEGSKCVAGWIGPCAFTPDLDLVQYVRIHQSRPVERMKSRDRKTIALRSDPLGLRDANYRVCDFVMVLPDLDKYVDNIKMEKLAVKIHGDPTTFESGDLLEHDVAVQFAINGVAWPVRLRYDVSFVAAAACDSGPHVLFCEYAYKAVSVRKLTNNFEWAGWNGATDSPTGYPDEVDDDTVLLIEAYGAADSACFARAWCAHMGLSAVVADISITCLACAIREGYAARMAVVIASGISPYSGHH